MSATLTPSQVQQRLIRVVVQTPEGSKRELREIARQLGDVNKSVNSLNSASRVLQSIWGAQIFGFAVSEIANMADSMTLLNARASIFSKEGTDVSAVVSSLIDVTRELRGPISDVAEGFARIQLSTASLNVEVESQIALSEVLAKSFKLSGATSAEASNSMIQLGQAFQRGSLRGQELNSVLTQNAILAAALTAEAKRVNSDVRTLAEQGYFTNQKVFGIIAESVPKILSQFEKLPVTFSDIFSRLRTEVTVLAGTINSSLNISTGIYNGLTYLLDILPQLTNLTIGLAVGATAVGVAFGTWTVIGAITPAVLGLTLAIAPLIANLGILGAGLAILKTGFMLAFGALFSWIGVAVAAVAGIGYLVKGFLDAYGGISNLDIVTQALKLTWDNFLNYSILGLVKGFQALALATRSALIFFTAGLSELTPVAKMFDSLNDKLNNYTDAISANIDMNNRYKSVLRDQAAARGVTGPELTDAEKLEANIKKTTDAIKAFMNGQNTEAGKVKSIAAQIGALNGEFAKTGNFDRYNERMKILERNQLNEQLEKGTISIRKFNLEIERNKLEEWQRKLDNGRASLLDFQVAVNTFSVKELKDKFDSGKISLTEFYSKLAEIADTGAVDVLDDKVISTLKEMNVQTNIFTKGWENAGSKIAFGASVGLNSYKESIRGLIVSTANATESIAGKLEDTLVDAFASGKDSFADFSNFVLAEITRIVVRLTIMKPLLESISQLMDTSGLFGVGAAIAGGFGSSTASAGATTGGYNLGSPGITVTPFNKVGDVFNNYSNSYESASKSTGSSVSSNVNVTIVNNTSSEIETRESIGSDGSRNLEFIINSQVNKGIAEGKFDNSMRNNYGIQRRT